MSEGGIIYSDEREESIPDYGSGKTHVELADSNALHEVPKVCQPSYACTMIVGLVWAALVIKRLVGDFYYLCFSMYFMFNRFVYHCL